MAKVMQHVCDDGEPVIITTPRRKVVMISLDDYNAMAATDYLLSNPANAAHIRESLQQAREGKFTKVELTDI
jgi:antitoxin YefM